MSQEQLVALASRMSLELQAVYRTSSTAFGLVNLKDILTAREERGRGSGRKLGYDALWTQTTSSWLFLHMYHKQQEPRAGAPYKASPCFASSLPIVLSDPREGRGCCPEADDSHQQKSGM